MVVNAWLVLITWLQHTEVDVPHMDAENWNFIKGALHTVDRPYGKVLDFLHHRIGSTHVAHHVRGLKFSRWINSPYSSPSPRVLLLLFFRFEMLL